jgi:hypothetical protein
LESENPGKRKLEALYRYPQLSLVKTNLIQEAEKEENG